MMKTVFGKPALINIDVILDAGYYPNVGQVDSDDTGIVISAWLLKPAMSENFSN